MAREIKSLLLIIFFFLGWFFLPPVVGFAKDLPATGKQFQSGELLVKFKGSANVYLIKIDRNFDLTAIQRQFDNSLIDFIEPNYTYQATGFPNDPHYFQQTYLDLIKARDAWSQELLARELENNNHRSVIAILDTGVNLNNPDLKANIWTNIKEIPGNAIDDDHNGYIDDVHGWNFIAGNNDSNPSFDSGYSSDAVQHGTLVAGIAAASSNNNQGITGGSWFSQIMPLKVLNSQGSGDVYDVVSAIDYAIANGADVINMSFVGSNYSAALFEAIERAYNKGVVVVAAAGNTDPKINGVNLDSSPSYPVCYRGRNNENIIIGVAAVSANLTKSSFSSYGGCIDLVAPGEDFYSTKVYNQKISGFETYYGGFWSGTSLATPVVSAVFATVKALRPEFSILDLHNAVLKTADNVDSYNPAFKRQLGLGLVNFNKSVEVAIARSLLTGNGNGNFIVVGLGFGSLPQIKILNPDGTLIREFYAYHYKFNGPINVATGDVDGDGKKEIITGAGAGGGPQIRIFDFAGQVKTQFFAADSKLRNGINLTVADINGDGRSEIITGAGVGSEALVKIFDDVGNNLGQFLAYAKPFAGGVNVAVADVNADGQSEIVTSPAQSGGGQIKIFNSAGQLVSEFWAYNKTVKKNGFNVAVGDVNNDSVAEILVAPDAGLPPVVRVFDGNGKLTDSFAAFETNFTKGVYLAVGDLNRDGQIEIIVGRGKGGLPEVKVFDSNGEIKNKFDAHLYGYRGGVRLSTIDSN